MNVDNFLKKIYTVAFRLTGDEYKAAYLAYDAISSSSSILNLSDKIPTEMLTSTIKEVCRLFLADSDNSNKIFKRFEQNTYAESFQEALMSLNTLSRTTVVWRDVLGWNLDDINIKGYNKKELYFELNNGRRLLKEFLRIYK